MPDRHGEADREAGAEAWDEKAHEMRVDRLCDWINVEFASMVHVRVENKKTKALIFDGAATQLKVESTLEGGLQLTVTLLTFGKPRTVGGPMDFEGGNKCTN